MHRIAVCVILICVVLLLPLRPTEAQSDTTTTYAGFGYTLEMPSGWSGRSLYFGDFAMIEITVLMPSAVPDFPDDLDEYDPFESLLHELGQMAGEWRDELTTQPAFIVYSVHVGGEELIVDEAALVANLTDPDNTTTPGMNFDTLEPITIGTLQGMSATGTIPGAGGLKDFNFQFYGAAFTLPGRVMLLGGVAPDTLFEGQQATFENMLQSFQLTNPAPFVFEQAAATHRFDGEIFSVQYPADWIFQVEDEEFTYFTNAAVPAGQSMDDLNNIFNAALANGEMILALTYFDAESSEVEDLDIFSPEAMMATLMKGTAFSALTEYTWQGTPILEGQLAVTEAFSITLYIMPKGDGFVMAGTFYPTAEPIDPTVVYTVLTSLKLK
ncbi:MAG: hypothetical protein BroJett018_52290 [Chloroflexota bacterium]|nr:MAG: hypothetical protein BroJett018_52290 [Chloroflexota bacterium]